VAIARPLVRPGYTAPAQIDSGKAQGMTRRGIDGVDGILSERLPRRHARERGRQAVEEICNPAEDHSAGYLTATLSIKGRLRKLDQRISG